MEWYHFLAYFTYPLIPSSDCGVPDIISNGGVNYGLTVYESEAQYFCLSTYNLEGPSKSVCLANASWSGPTPICDYVGMYAYLYAAILYQENQLFISPEPKTAGELIG